MIQIIRKLRIFLSAIFVVAYIAAPAYADDIDIYKEENLGGSVRPNILFILDTSISMASTINTPVPYSQTEVYSGCFDVNKVYKVATDAFATIACTQQYQNQVESFSKDLVMCRGLLNAISNQPQAVLDATTDPVTLAAPAVGFFTDRYAQWDDNNSRKYWTDLYRDQNGYVIECMSDNGTHGAADGDGLPYIDVVTSAEYTSNSANSSWNNLGEQLTLVGGNYMNYWQLINSDAAATDDLSKLEIMKNTIVTLTGSITGVNVALMRFNYNEGGKITYAMNDVEASRNDMYANMKNWQPVDWTPLSEALYEGYLYYKGAEPKFGTNLEGSVTMQEGNTTYYKTPVDPDFSECQRQYVILLSDGEPTGDLSANADIRGLTGSSCDGNCLDELAEYMYTTNARSYIGDGQYLNGVRVSTYTVAFDVSVDVMKRAGNLGTGNPATTGTGQGGYFEASNAALLLSTLESIISSISQIHTTFSSPAVSVNAFNRTTHRSDLYFTLFSPDIVPHWDGNFKRFKLVFDPDTGNPYIVDANGAPAIDGISGYFKADSLSYWTQGDPDGDETAEGGAASHLSNVRNVYSNLSNDADLNILANTISVGNTALTAAMLGVPDAERDDFIEYVRGMDAYDEDGDSVTNESRKVMGDPLHGQPALVQYDGPDSDPEIIAYVSTNDGFLHAFDTRIDHGEELFAFIPSDLLTKMPELKPGATGSKLYGLDGTVVPWVQDENENGIIEGNDRVILFFGMRRGGRNYYAMDVTNPNDPQFLWKIEGGTGNFTELGQSWSKPTVRKIKVGGTEQNVLIFAAGYDTNQDSATLRTTDSVGRGIYMVNPLTGALLWKADSNTTGFSDMQYSIPSDVAAVDSNGDGYTDHVYVGDMGGQVWRVDIDNSATSGALADIITGGRIADLADSSAASARRFYYPPDVALMREVAGGPYLALILVSGNRSNPTQTTVQDRVFMLRDRPINAAPTSYTTITENDSIHNLLDTTDNLIGQGSQTEIDAATANLQSKNGWYIDLDASVGEKGMAKPLIFAGEAFYTTYIPPDPNSDVISCAPDEGTGLLYHVNIADGTPVKNYEQIISQDDDNLTREDRLVNQLTKKGIPAEPKIIMPDSNNTALCVGTECFKKDIIGTHETLYWYEE